MPNLVDASFFVGDINIPNTQKPEIAESLNIFISRYEKELLIHLFGFELYNSYLLDPSTDRFVKIINGSVDDNWRGLVYNITDTVKGSLIAYYVYNFWLKDKHVWNSGVGTVRAKGNVTDVMPVAIKMTDAWNEFSRQVLEFSYYMGQDGNADVYPEWQSWGLCSFRKTNDFDI